VELLSVCLLEKEAQSKEVSMSIQLGGGLVSVIQRKRNLVGEEKIIARKKWSLRVIVVEN